MTENHMTATRWRVALLGTLILAGGGGYWLGQRGSDAASTATPADGRKVLYYYDPMFPQQKFDKPGKSPFMGMQLEPKYADQGGAGAAPGITIDPSAMQNLGIRVVAAQMGTLAATLNVTGSIDFNQRDVAIIQARSGGFVSRVYGRAPACTTSPGARP